MRSAVLHHPRALPAAPSGTRVRAQPAGSSSSSSSVVIGVTRIVIGVFIDKTISVGFRQTPQLIKHVPSDDWPFVVSRDLENEK
jgi:hypothetical protein